MKKQQKPKNIKSTKNASGKKPAPAAKEEKGTPSVKIAIIGAGPIGSILGAYLSRTTPDGKPSRNHVTIVDVIKDRLDSINAMGITLAGVVNFQTNVFGTTHKISDLKKLAPEYIFICAKASALPVILRQVKTAMSKQTGVIAFLNGLDVEQEVSEALGKHRVIRAVINYAGNLMSEGRILMSFFNTPNYIGGLSPESNALAEKVAKMLTEAGLTTKFTSDIRQYTWEKAILNSTLAPVCGITRLKMNDAMAMPQIKNLVQQVLKEGITVAKAHGYEFGKKFYANALEYLNKTGAHKPSMLIDIESRQPTEINYMNGKITEYAQSKNIPVPFNETLTSLVKGLEKSFSIIVETTKKDKPAEPKTEEPSHNKWGSGHPRGKGYPQGFNRQASAYEMPAKPKITPPAKPEPLKQAAQKKKNTGRK